MDNIFYIDELHQPVFKSPAYHHMSDLEWLESKNIPINKTVRGYQTDEYIHLYTGKDFLVPDISIVTLALISCEFKVKEIWLGVQMKNNNEPGKPVIKLKFE
jgi:hypothetical protein